MKPTASYIPREKHGLSRKDIDEDAVRILYRLTEHDHEAYIVGGGVRDLLIGKKPKDFDIATSATPKQIKSIFRNSRIIGRRFKLAHIYFRDGKKIEVATFRDDSAQFETPEGEEPASLADDNVFGTAATDAVRRDLTINALFLDVRTMTIVDYVGGLADIRDRLVRIIGDPERRFREDPVRMMRAARHAARTGFSVEESAVAAIQRVGSLLAEVPEARIYDEVKKDLLSGAFSRTLELIDELGLLRYLLPEVAGRGLVKGDTKLGTLLRSVDQLVAAEAPPSMTTVLALLVLGPALDDLSGLFASWQDAEHADRFIRQAFSVLAVPRRERERLYDVLTLLAAAKSATPPPLNKLRSRPGAHDLPELLRFIAIDEQDEDLLVALSEGGDADSSPADQDSRPRRRRRRRR